MYRIFISYSSKSEPIVARLAEDLALTGHHIWFDHQLTGGQTWWDTILDEIRQCDIFIFALTSDALESYACKLEYTYAHKLGKPVLPVMMDPKVQIHQLPNELQLIQFVDYTSPDTQAAFRLVNALNSAPLAASLPDPLPEAPPVPLSYVGKLREQIDSPQLSFDEQASIVFKLKERLQDGDSPEEARGLLERLRRRDDLYAKIDREIEDLLQSSRPVSARLFSRRDRERQPDATEEAPRAKDEQRAAPKRERSGSVQPTPTLTIALGAIFLVGSGAIFGLCSIFAVDNLAGYFLLAIAIFVHGIFTQRVLGGTFIVPGKRSLVLRLLGIVLSGGPLNGFALRRFSAGTTWLVVVLVLAGWLAVIIVVIGFFYWYAGLNGLVMGVLGALVTLILYAQVRRRSSNH